MKRFISAALITLATAAGLVLGANSASAVEAPGGSTCSKTCWAHYVVFRGNPMMEWYNHVKATPILAAKFDMSNNGCSASAAKAYLPSWLDDDVDSYSRIFHRACVLHDFGYRNFGPGEVHVNEAYLLSGQRDWNADTDKEYIDQRFHALMDKICVARDDIDGWDACEQMSDAFYAAVRWGGNTAWNNG